MSLPDYDVISRQLKLTRCRGIQPTGQTCFLDHEKGTTEIRGAGERVVHWSDRKTTRRGLRTFLLLVSNFEMPVEMKERWKQIVWSNQWAVRMALLLGIRLPADLADHDRATVRAMVVNLPTSDERDAALKWARR